MRRRIAIGLVALCGALGASLATSPSAGAHPLGNFTINHYSRVQPAGDRIYVLYALDMAEIPTFRARQLTPSAGAYAAATVPEIARELELEVDGRRLPLMPVAHAAALAPGVAGLKTMRLQVVLRTPTIERGDTPRTLRYLDRSFAGRIGWKEIVVAPAGDAIVDSSSAPSQSISDELFAYPNNRLQSPPDVTSATASFEPGTSSGPPPTLVSGPALAKRVAVRQSSGTGGFASLVAERHLSVGFVLLSLAIALFWGAAHAFSPGHGKAIVAGYLVGSRGRVRDALILGLIVTVTHTSGVFALGGVTLLLSAFIVPEQLYPWLNLASAVLVVGVGLTILRWRIRVWRRGDPIGQPHHHDHHHHGRGHEQAHEHGDGYASDHEHATGGRSGLLGIGVSAGIIPCPTALVVLLAAISLQRVGYGLALIFAFSIGLAVAVTGIGLVAVLARKTFSRVSLDGAVVRALPAVSALVVLSLGVAMIARALPGVL
jgi:nickel/cobalt transporter (NicO) family protein